MTQEQTLKSQQNHSFLDLFKRAKVEFLKSGTKEKSPLYKSTYWEKSKSVRGSAFDCLRVERNFPQKLDTDQEETEFTVKVSLWLDSTPERFLVSEDLQAVLGIKEETRARIVAALWQYIK